MEPEGVPVAPASTFLDEFRAGLDAGEVRAQRCDGCGELRLPPRRRCAACGSAASTWVATSGHGVVWSVGVFHKPYLPDRRVPYNVAIVRLDEGPRLLTNILGADEYDDPRAEIAIGMPVHAEFGVDGAGRPLVRFRPDGDGGRA